MFLAYLNNAKERNRNLSLYKSEQLDSKNDKQKYT